MAGSRCTRYEERNGCGVVVAESPGPVRSAWNAVLLVFATCLLLWLCVQVLQSIWIWLVGGVVIGLVISVTTLLLRRRRGRW